MFGVVYIQIMHILRPIWCIFGLCGIEGALDGGEISLLHMVFSSLCPQVFIFYSFVSA